MNDLEYRIRDIVGRHMSAVSRDFRYEIEQALIADLLAELRPLLSEGATVSQNVANNRGTVIGVWRQ